MKADAAALQLATAKELESEALYVVQEVQLADDRIRDRDSMLQDQIMKVTGNKVLLDQINNIL